MPRSTATVRSKPTESEIKAAFSALDRQRREDPRGRKAALAEARARRRQGTKLLTAYLKRTGFDLAGLERARAQSEAALRRLAEDRRAAAVKRSPAVRKDLLQGIGRWRRTLDRLRDGTLTSDFVPTLDVVDTPFLIWPTNGIELIDSRLEPWNSTARINAQWRASGGSENLRFIFVWQNPSSDRWAVVNVESTLVLNGSCDAFGEGGILSGSVNNLSVAARLNVLEWWNQPPTSPFPQATQSQHVLSLAASGGGFLSALGGGTVESASASGTFDLSRRLFLLPPSGVTVVESTLAFSYSNFDGGMIQIDFASGDFAVVCPAVVIAILS